MTGGRPETHVDFRGLPDRKDIDAVVIATPRPPARVVMVAACEAGKEVEKPISHNVCAKAALWRSDPATLGNALPTRGSRSVGITTATEPGRVAKVPPHADEVTTRPIRKAWASPGIRAAGPIRIGTCGWTGAQSPVHFRAADLRVFWVMRT